MSKPQNDEAFHSLTVTVGGRAYPLRVLPEDEGPIARIAKEINDKLATFQQTYQGKDKQDFLAMLLLIYAVDLYKVKDGGRDVDPQLLSSLSNLEEQLSEALTRSGNSN